MMMAARGDCGVWRLVHLCGIPHHHSPLRTTICHTIVGFMCRGQTDSIPFARQGLDRKVCGSRFGHVPGVARMGISNPHAKACDMKHRVCSRFNVWHGHPLIYGDRAIRDDGTWRGATTRNYKEEAGVHRAHRSHRGSVAPTAGDAIAILNVFVVSPLVSTPFQSTSTENHNRRRELQGQRREKFETSFDSTG